ncbi:TetR/AcrR family transcriptional regulator C-terminal domain-containing protein [Staphylococcus chromogenes]|nr:TetR/AcrR family transcriptional regulator C-terminal domain-containing protein [Staphylococcus chromogenes]
MQLSREVIVAEAMLILDEFGLGDLTMRRLAKQLDVVPGALYWHVPNKQSLLEAIAESIVAPVLDLGAERGVDTPWQHATHQIARTLRDAMVAHRDGADVVSAALPVGDLRTRIIDALCEPLSGADLDDAARRLAGNTVLDFVMGYTVSEQATTQLAQVTGGCDHPGAGNHAERNQRFDAGLSIVLAGVSSLTQLR